MWNRVYLVKCCHFALLRLAENHIGNCRTPPQQHTHTHTHTHTHRAHHQPMKTQTYGFYCGSIAFTAQTVTSSNGPLPGFHLNTEGGRKKCTGPQLCLTPGPQTQFVVVKAAEMDCRFVIFCSAWLWEPIS